MIEFYEELDKAVSYVQEEGSVNLEFVIYPTQLNQDGSRRFEIAEAESECEGCIKYDGCIDFFKIESHFCGIDVLNNFLKIMQKIQEKAWELGVCDKD